MTLKFAEIYAGTQANFARVFNVSVNGVTLIGSLDVYAQVGGGYTAYDQVLNNITPVNGQIAINFGAGSANNPKVDAIQIIPQATAPTVTPTITPPCSPSTFGKTAIGGSGFGVGGGMDGNLYTLSAPGTVVSLSLYMTNAPGSVRMAIYSNNTGTPQNLLGETKTQLAVTGWNTLALTAPVSLAAGNYWLAFQTSPGSQGAFDTGAANSMFYLPYSYGAFPSTFPIPIPTPGYFNTFNFSQYGNVCP